MNRKEHSYSSMEKGKGNHTAEEKKGNHSVEKGNINQFIEKVLNNNSI